MNLTSGFTSHKHLIPFLEKENNMYLEGYYPKKVDLQC